MSATTASTTPQAKEPESAPTLFSGLTLSCNEFVYITGNSDMPKGQCNDETKFETCKACNLRFCEHAERIHDHMHEQIVDGYVPSALFDASKEGDIVVTSQDGTRLDQFPDHDLGKGQSADVACEIFFSPENKGKPVYVGRCRRGEYQVAHLFRDPVTLLPRMSSNGTVLDASLKNAASTYVAIQMDATQDAKKRKRKRMANPMVADASVTDADSSASKSTAPPPTPAPAPVPAAVPKKK